MTKETYLKSVDVLLDAYINSTLFHGTCSHCAVGNLLGTMEWNIDFYTAVEDNIANQKMRSDIFEPNSYIFRKLQELYASKGFTREELMKIEFAFESSLTKTEEGYEYYTESNDINILKKGNI